MSAVQAPNLQILIERARSELFSAAAKEQRLHLAEAWGNLRSSAALLADADHGRVPPDRLREALERAQAGISALRVLCGLAVASGGS